MGNFDQPDTITKHDIFNWYNQEITRYRDHEWQVAGFSIAITSAILFFGTSNETKGILPFCLLLCPLVFQCVISMIVEQHSHNQINKYRTLRERILDYSIEYLLNPDKSEIKVKDSTGLDQFYYWCFLFIPPLYSFIVIHVLLMQSTYFCYR